MEGKIAQIMTARLTVLGRNVHQTHIMWLHARNRFDALSDQLSTTVCIKKKASL